jgi:hypothetical protein
MLALPAVAAPPRAHVVTTNNSSCDVGTYAAATLLLPFFNVDYNVQSTAGVDTIFTVINTSKYPQIARITLWTDLGYPAMWFSEFLTGYDAQTISLYEILSRGNFPVTFANTPHGALSVDNDTNPNFQPELRCSRLGGKIPYLQLQQLQKILTTGELTGSDCPVGLSHKTAMGYVTIDVVNNCSTIAPTDPAYFREILLYDNVLTGDYERINPNTETGNYAGGNPLVHIRAIPEGGPAGSAEAVPMPYTFYDRYTPPESRKLDRRQPLPSAFGARFIQGGPTGFFTNLAIWREGVVGPTRSACEYARNANLPVPKLNIVRFDEHENATVLSSDVTMSPVTLIPTEQTNLLPPLAGSGDVAGWVWMSLDNGAGRAAENNPYSINRPSQGWVTIQMYAEGRYAVDFDATALANGCTLQSPVAP